MMETKYCPELNQSCSRYGMGLSRRIIGSLRRWVYFGVAFAVCTIIGGILLRALRELANDVLLKTFGDLHWSIQTTTFVLLTTLFFYLLFRLSPLETGQLSSIYRYPPTWLAVCSALALIWFADLMRWIGPGAYGAPGWQWELVVGGAVTLVAIGKWTSAVPTAPKREVQEAVDLSDASPRTWESLREWVAAEKPAETDLLDRRPIARRIAELLLLPLGQDRTIGLIGPFGSGKTSIVSWLEDEIGLSRKDRQPAVWICPVSCWGFENSSAAIHHLLSKVIVTVSAHADCFSLRQLPEAYRKALSTGARWLPSVVEALIGQPDPMDQLQRITPILEIMNARLVIVLEDLEREKSPSFDMQDILALLHRLRSVLGVSFILTGARPLKSGIDYAKLCDHVEVVPELEAEAVIGHIVALRDHCLGKYDDVVPAATCGRGPGGTELWSGISSRTGLYALLGVDFMSSGTAVASLITTPRSLKHVLRHTALTWERLHGEVDFDELVITNVLRYGAPEAFSFVLERADLLRSHRAASREERQLSARRRKRLLNDWRKGIQDVEWDSRAAMELIVFLMPSASWHMRNRQPYDQGSPQGVRHRVHTDYWRRLLAERLSPGELRDQEILRATEDWNKNPTADRSLVQRLYAEEKFAETWDHFSHRVPDSLVLKLASQVFGLILSRDRSRARGEHPAAEAIWRRATRIMERNDGHRVWLESMIRGALCSSLQFAVDLFHDWASVHNGILARPEDRQMVHRAMVEDVKATFSAANGQSLLTILNDAWPFTIYQLMVLPGRNSQDGELADGADWKWAAPILLAAAQADRAKMIPQLAHLLNDARTGRHGESVPMLNETRILGIFGSRAREALTFLSEETQAEQAQEQTFLDAVRRQAMERLQTPTQSQFCAGALGAHPGA